jgi:prolyl oligopeptidase PreP (S9A serine peptidase family)
MEDLQQQAADAFYWRNGLDGEEHVLIDPNSFDPELHVSVESVFVTQDGERFAYSWSINNSDEADLHIVDIASGRLAVSKAVWVRDWRKRKDLSRPYTSEEVRKAG